MRFLASSRRQRRRRTSSSSCRSSLGVVAAVLFSSLFSAVFVSARKRSAKVSNPNSRSIIIKNESGSKIDAFWINPTTRKIEASNFENGIVYGGEGPLSSYVGHSFEVQELPVDNDEKKAETPNQTGSAKKCRKGMCRKAYLTVNKNYDQLFIIKPDFSVMIEDSKTRAKEKAQSALQKCTDLISSSSSSSESGESDKDRLDLVTKCLEEQIDAALKQEQEEIVFQQNVRKSIGNRLVEYACRDPLYNASEPVRNETWTYRYPPPTSSATQKHDARCLFETDASSIWLIEKFLSSNQCEDMVHAAVPMEADPGRLVLPLKAREDSKVVDLALHKISQLVKTFLGVSVEYTQDPMMEVVVEDAIESSSAISSTKPIPKDGGEQRQCVVDEKDGSCVAENADGATPSPMVSERASTGEPQPKLVRRNDGDMATLRIFCDAPSDAAGSGGAIHFHKTGDHVKPVKGDALLIVYQDPTVREEEPDPFIDEYYECPPVVVKEDGGGDGENADGKNRFVTIIDHYGNPSL